MSAPARTVGVYPVEAREPCHFCELIVTGECGDIDFGAFTQQLPERDSSYWQVAYDARKLLSEAGEGRYVFFFHYLDLDKPLEPPFGSLALPRPAPRPERLGFIEYQDL